MMKSDFQKKSVEPSRKREIVDLSKMKTNLERTITDVREIGSWIRTNSFLRACGDNGKLARLASNLYDRAVNPLPSSLSGFDTIDRFCAEKSIISRVRTYSTASERQFYCSENSSILIVTQRDRFLDAFNVERLSSIFLNRRSAPWIKTVLVPGASDPIPISLSHCRQLNASKFISRTKDGTRTLVALGLTLLLYDDDVLSYLLWQGNGLGSRWTDSLQVMLVLSGEMPELTVSKNEILPGPPFPMSADELPSRQPMTEDKLYGSRLKNNN